MYLSLLCAESIIRNQSTWSVYMAMTFTNVFFAHELGREKRRDKRKRGQLRILVVSTQKKRGYTFLNV